MSRLALLGAALVAACTSFTTDDAVVRTGPDDCAVVWIESGEAWLGLNDEEQGAPELGRQCITIMRGQWARAWSDGQPGEVHVGHQHARLVIDPGNLQEVCPIDCFRLGR